MTPESLTQLFNMWGIAIVFGFGILCRRFPWLKNMPRDLIPWIGSVLVMLQQLAVSAAQAQGADSVVTVVSQVTEPSGIGIAAVTSAGWAHTLYNAFFKGLLDRILPWPEPKQPYLAAPADARPLPRVPR